MLQHAKTHRHVQSSNLSCFSAAVQMLPDVLSRSGEDVMSRIVEEQEASATSCFSGVPRVDA